MNLRSRLFTLTVVILLAFAAYSGYRDRFRIASKVWHWRHGYICRIGNYDVPVPEHWLPKYDVPGDLFLYDTEKLASVGVLPGTPTRDLDFWETWHRQRLESNHVSRIVQNRLFLESQTVACIGGTEFRDELKIPMPNVISLDCASTGDLHLMFDGDASTLSQFYAIASGIRIHK